MLGMNLCTKLKCIVHKQNDYLTFISIHEDYALKVQISFPPISYLPIVDWLVGSHVT